MATPQRIAVLGAGPMGLAVAYQLTQDGHHPVVFEADDRVGGMTATFDFGGLDIDGFANYLESHSPYTPGPLDRITSTP